VASATKRKDPFQTPGIMFFAGTTANFCFEIRNPANGLPKTQKTDVAKCGEEKQSEKSVRRPAGFVGVRTNPQSTTTKISPARTTPPFDTRAP
jgi:hypothetical protein